MTTAERVVDLLTEARDVLGDTATGVMLRVETQLLETVYLRLADGNLHAHDHGRTFTYLSRETDGTYVAWNQRFALNAAEAAGVELVDSSNDDGESFAFARLVQPAEDVVSAVTRIAVAIDATFSAHLRSHIAE